MINLKDVFHNAEERLLLALQAFGQFSGHDHTIFINKYLQNFDVIISKYLI